MPNPAIQIIGVYKVPLTEDLFREAMELKYGELNLTAEQREEAEQGVRAELGSVVLIECQVTGADSRFEVGDFCQAGSDQAAYDEAFFAADGTVLATRYANPQTPDFRVCFFLHFYEPRKALESSYGVLQPPPASDMPDRLRNVMPYEPVS